MKIIITESQLLNVIKESNSFDVINTLKKGQSLFSKKKFKKGDKVGTLLSTTPSKNGREVQEGLYETNVIGRYINHSSKPNTEARKDGKEVVLYSIKDINEGDEILVDYSTIEKMLGVLPGTYLEDDFKD